MINPRVTRLVRVAGPRSMQATVARLAGRGVPAVRRCAALVPTRGAAEELRRSLENASLRSAGAITFPDLLTRSDFYERLHTALPHFPRSLSPQEREVLLRRAARIAATSVPPPFSLRPGLVLEMLRFYDELRRREQSLDDFTRLAIAHLAPTAESDRGAERLLRQTEFLGAAYAEFERLTNETGGIDEHGLRTLLLHAPVPAQSLYAHVIVTVADQAADPHGLYASDFDLLSRLGGLERLDVVATENLLAAGFHERIHDLLPGIEEVREAPGSAGAAGPSLLVPEQDDRGRCWFTCRDREEELSDFVRHLKHRAVSTHETLRTPPLDRCAVVFQRPLPYLYLSRYVFADGAVPYGSSDALPLSGEPFAAALDLVLSFLTAEANRASIVALLRSPHFRFPADENSITAFDRRLRALKYAGGWEHLSTVAVEGSGERALDAARSIAAALSPVRNAGAASGQIEALLAFVRGFEAPASQDAPWQERHARARAAVIAVLESLREAHARHDDEPLEVSELAGMVRRWIDAQTFAPVTSSGGVRLMAAAAAPYADVDELRIVGLVEGDWPEPARRSIFYPASILSQLGWPPESARTSAARAKFRDLVKLPCLHVSGSSFTLEEDSLVAPSPFVEELDSCELAIERVPEHPAAIVFEHEAMCAEDPVALHAQSASGERSAQWLALRVARSSLPDERRAGRIGAKARGPYAVSALERYLDCPFKYYASSVLRLPDEPDDETGLTPRERGHFIHGVFEQFFADWQRAGNGSITTRNVGEALDRFESIAESTLDLLPDADRALERTHLLGSAAASGLAERAFAFEIEQGGEVVERLLEHQLEGTFEFESADGRRPIALRAKADRIDLMDDGTLRVIDYKLSRAPKAARALQLPVYGVCAEQALEGRHGRSWRLAQAGYVAFKEKDPFVPLGGRSTLGAALKEGQQRLVDTVAAIEQGLFPVRPDEPFRCQWCGYAGVCRKDYVGDE